MLDTANCMREADERRGHTTSLQPDDDIRKDYTPPQIEDFGRIADLTHNASGPATGDFVGGSYGT